MNGTQLKEYVSMIYEIEKSIYQQNNLYESVVEKSKRMQGRPTQIKMKGDFVQWASLLGGGIGVVLGLAVESIFLKILLFFFAGPFFILGIFFLKNNAKTNSDFGEEYEKSVARYESETPLREELASLARELPYRIEKSKALLRQMYSIGVIYPKYQNLIAISSFYDYLMSGRCSELEGHEGAYNIYEMEARLDRIVTQLDIVIAKLDKIQQNQYMLYRAIQEGNKQNQEFLGKLTSAVKGVNERLDAQGRSIAYAAYEAELTRKELQYQSSMNRIYGNWR